MQVKTFLLFLFLLQIPYLIKSDTNCSIPNCIQCSNDPSNLTCLQCETGFYYNREEQICFYEFPCNMGEYKSSKDGTCSECSSECAGCIGPESYSCTACPAGSFLLVSNSYRKCMSCLGHFCNECDEVGDCITCKKGYWLNKTSGDCSPCLVTDCEKCDSDISGCDDCKYGFVYDQQKKSCNLDSSCPLSQYENFVNVCMSCDPSCRNCYGSSNKECYECAKGFFFNEISECVPCNKTCADCEFDAEYCVECASPLRLRGQDCVNSCAADEYYDFLEQKCKKCDPLCGTCINSPNYCLSCADEVNYQLTNTTCTPKCGTGKYVRIDYYNYLDYLNQLFKQFIDDSYTSIKQGGSYSCGACQYPCVNCMFNKDYCTECPPTMSLYPSNGKCYTICPTGTYHKFDLSANQSLCLECDPSCSDCYNLTTCKKCASPYTLKSDGSCYYNETRMGVCEDYEFIIGDLCLDQCPKGSFASGQLCFCNETCEACYYRYTVSDSVSCDLCRNTNYYSYGGTCFPTCPNNTWIVDEGLIESNNHDSNPPYDHDGDGDGRGDHDGDGDGDGRDGGRHLQSQKIQTKYCYDNCPSYYIKLFQNNTRFCTKTCPPGYQNYQGTCLMTTCPSGTYYNPFNTSNAANYSNLTQQEYYDLFCSKCDSSCAECNGPTIYNCMKCQQGLYLQSSDNITEQEILSFFHNYGQGSSYSSQELMKFYQSYGAFCNKTCPLGFIADTTGICMLCLSECDYCVPPLKKNQRKCAISCPGNTVYNASSNECTNYYYLDLEILNGYQDINSKTFVSYIQDTMLELKIKDALNSQTAMNISSLSCSFQVKNQATQQSLFIRSFNYAFIVYDFAIPADLFSPDSSFSVHCSVTLVSPPQDLTVDYDLFTFPRPTGYFNITPLSGVSLVDNFTVTIKDWNIDQSSPAMIFNYVLSLKMNNSNIYLLQMQNKNPSEIYNFTYLFPFCQNTAQAIVELKVSNNFTESTNSINITIENQDILNISLNQINFQSIGSENLNIFISAFAENNQNLIQNESNSFENSADLLYNTINSSTYYTCQTSDCVNGYCNSQITDPNKKCTCYPNYGGSSCKWSLSQLAQSSNFFLNTLNYLENITQSNQTFLVLNDILSKIALFPDTFNKTMLEKALNLLKNVSNFIATQSEAVSFIGTMNNYMNVMKLLKTTTSTYSNYIDILRNCLDQAIQSIAWTLGQSSQKNLSLSTNNIKLTVKSLNYLANETNISSISVGVAGDQGQGNASVTIQMTGNTSSYINFYCEKLFLKSVLWSSDVLSSNNSDARFFSNILSIELKNIDNYKNDIILENGNNYTLLIPKIVNIISSANNIQASSLYSCLYYDNSTKNWNNKGVSFVKEYSDYIECISTHLTDFSVQLTTDNQIIYDYLDYSNYNSNKDNDEKMGKMFKGSIVVLIFFLIFSIFFFIWYLCIAAKKEYASVSTIDESQQRNYSPTNKGITNQLQPKQIEIRAVPDKEGGNAIQVADMEQAKPDDM